MTIEHNWVETRDRAVVAWVNDFRPWSFPFHVDDSNSTIQTKYETIFSLLIRVADQTFFQSVASADVCNSVVFVKCSCKSRYLRRHKNQTFPLFDSNEEELTLEKSFCASRQRMPSFVSYPHGYWLFSVDAMCYSDWKLDRGRVLISAVVPRRHSTTFASSVEFPLWIFGHCHWDVPQQWYDASLFCSLLQRNNSYRAAWQSIGDLLRVLRVVGFLLVFGRIFTCIAADAVGPWFVVLGE